VYGAPYVISESTGRLRLRDTLWWKRFTAIQLRTNTDGHLLDTCVGPVNGGIGLMSAMGASFDTDDVMIVDFRSKPAL
jgi:hypothetical protein